MIIHSHTKNYSAAYATLYKVSAQHTLSCQSQPPWAAAQLAHPLALPCKLFLSLYIVKRLQDKEKLKDFDKIKLQLEQLLEFKSRIMESQTSLQRELQRAKQEAREAVEARDAHTDEMADLAETVEMATLDKEMAEEKVRLTVQFILLIHYENCLVFVTICLNVDIF
jgi:hypothetical protein